MLRQIRRYEQMATLAPGERVSFFSESGQAIVGVVERFNQKTVTVRTDDGHHWRVAPSLLSKTTEVGAANNSRGLRLLNAEMAVGAQHPGPLFERK
jgi:hypothetical protein